MKLPPVKFKKVKREEATALRVIALEYLLATQKDLTHQLSVRFHTSVQEAALLAELFLSLRTKLESGKAHFALSINVAQAVTLLFACSAYFKAGVPTYENSVALNFINEIDHQLKSINFNAGLQVMIMM